MRKKTILDAPVESRRTLVRVDFNVPIDDGRITDDTRIRAALPTLTHLQKRGARTIIVSHLGRPKGEVVEHLRLDLVADRLAALLGQPVKKIDTTVGAEAEAAANALADGEFLLLENVRFDSREEANDGDFAESLARLADVYVNDAFGAAHRAHASTEGVARLLPAYSGLLLAKELDVLSGALEQPARPFLAILGGAKVSDKIGVIESLLDKVDTLAIGGGMAYTFFKAKGYEIGKSLLDEARIEFAKDIMVKAEQKGVELILPVDIVVADDFSPDANTEVVAADAMPAEWEGVDIGPNTRQLLEAAIAKAKTILWNGPVGVFEIPAFSQGTAAVARAVAASEGMTIIGGGDSAAAAQQLGLADRFSHVSTGGGASLEFLEGKTLPGVAVIQDA